MTMALTTFASDRSPRWILLPGVASTRQVEIRNNSDSALEVHVRVDEPSTASASPAILTIQPHHSRIADVIFLATWSPEQDRRVVLSLRDPQGQVLGSFSQEIVAADSADCKVSLDLRDDFIVDDATIIFKLWCTVVSQSATPRRFEVDVTPHPSLRFPERRTVTLAPGESNAFEIPVRWNRSIRDVSGWNHPRAIETFIPVSGGRRSAILPWENVERRAAPYLTADDQRQKAATPGAERRGSFLEKTAGQLKYEELVELKRLEQGVVAPARQRPVQPPAEPQTVAPAPRSHFPVAPLVTIALALVALVLAGFFFLRPPEKQVAQGPMSVSPLKLSPTPAAQVIAKHHAAPVNSVAVPAWTTVTQAAASSNTVTPVVTYTAKPAPRPVAVVQQSRSLQAPTIDRNQVVALSDVEAAYASGGRAVNVLWYGQAQASVLIQLVAFTGKVIASRTVHGANGALLRLPRGYRGPVSVSVTAYGYHGERVVQSASLSPQD